MPFDPSTLTRTARENYINIGRGFGSTGTRAQAEQTLNALVTWGSELASHGFGPAHRDRLQQAHDALPTAAETRSNAAVAKLSRTSVFHDVLADAKVARQQVVSVLRTTRDDLAELDTDDAKTARAAIDAVLDGSNRSGHDAARTRNQLVSLKNALANPTIAARSAGHGGPAATSAATNAVVALDRAMSAHAEHGGTNAETELMNLLDGVIVTECRRARRAARALARATGRPALAAAFELDQLRHFARRTPSSGGSTAPSGSSPAPTTPSTPSPSGGAPPSGAARTMARIATAIGALTAFASVLWLVS